MKAIFYYSKACVPFHDQDFKNLELNASTNNKQIGVSGYLCFYKGYFFQYIEGEDNTVTELMSQIKEDRRHSIIKIMETENIGIRRFPSWDMKVFSPMLSIELSLEKIIYDHFDIVHHKNESISEEIWRPLLWRLIDKLAEFHQPKVV